jgi:hypothetical protein
VLGPWHLIVAPFATPMWPGYVQDWKVSLLDAGDVGVIFETRGRWPRLAILVPFVAHILAATIAVFQAKIGILAMSTSSICVASF